MFSSEFNILIELLHPSTRGFSVDAIHLMEF